MSREDLTRFIHSVEHSYTLRKKLKGCKTVTELLELAREYRFTINKNDLEDDEVSERIDNWFRNSVTTPFKQS